MRYEERATIMRAKKTGTSPSLLIHPGETIADVLEDRGMTRDELAGKMGVDVATIGAVIDGRADIPAHLAVGLERALGVPRSFWSALQANYDKERRMIDDAAATTGHGLIGAIAGLYKTLRAVMEARGGS